MGRILIADDNPGVRRALTQLLEGTNTVFEVEDGRAALARALELRPDLIILDLAMPTMDGLTAAGEISKVLPEIPILMYTMHWATPLELEARKSGIRKVISKGRTQDLLAAVEELLQIQPAVFSQVNSVQGKPLEPAATPQDAAIIATADDPSTQPLTDPASRKLAS